MKAAQKPLTTTKAPARRASAAQAIGIRAVTGRSTASKATASAAKNQASPVLTQGSYRMATTMPVRALNITVDVDLLVGVVRRHVHLTPSLANLIKGDFAQLFRDPALAPATGTSKPKPAADTDPVLSTQDAADLIGVSRPYLVARIEAGDIPLHQQVGNQRRVLKSAVLAWHRREQARRRRALGHLGADLDSEIFAG